MTTEKRTPEKKMVNGTALVADSRKQRGGRIYPRLALSGIVKNRRTYGPYLLSCIGMVMMYYILWFLMESDRVANMKGGNTLQNMLSLGSGVFRIFVVIFLFYTNSFLIKNRKREFGLYNILGMGKGNLARVLIWESLMMAVASLAGGLLCGILFSKFAELCMARILDGEISMSFSIEFSPIRSTLLLFVCVFALILLNALFQVGKSKPIDLMNSEAAGEKPPKANWLLAVLGVVILGSAYYIAVTIEDPMSAFLLFFVAVGMVILATYLLFIAGSVVLCRILQKNKRYYYKANHFVSVSSMMYRMKRNGAGLASICILGTMVLVMLSSTTCMYFGNEDRLGTRYPQQIGLYCYTSDEDYLHDENYIERIKGEVDQALQDRDMEKQQELDYGYFCISVLLQENQCFLDEEKINGLLDYSDVRDVYFVSLEDYNRITEDKETLGPGEVLLYTPRSGYAYDTITVDGCETWSVKKQVKKFVDNGDAMASIISPLYLVVPDIRGTIQSIRTKLESQGDGLPSEIYYYGLDITGDEEAQQILAQDISSRLDVLAGENEDFASISRYCRAAEKADFYALYSGLFVLGILLGIVFLAATVLIMYYKQVTEGYEDQSKFDIMQRVGMTKKEIRSSIHSQMFTVFLAPLLLAGIHTAFAFPIVQKLLLIFGVINTKLLIWTSIVCFLVFALFYFIVYSITSRSYYRIVSGRQE